jgi:hypothetical protein
MRLGTPRSGHVADIPDRQVRANNGLIALQQNLYSITLDARKTYQQPNAIANRRYRRLGGNNRDRCEQIYKMLGLQVAVAEAVTMPR